jgi:uncharacterized membrane protein YvbJ
MSQLTENYSVCPYCGKSVMKGAMRCVSCCKLLKTPDEQAESIRQLTAKKKRFNFRGMIKLLFLLAAVGYVYFYYSDRVIQFVRGMLDK